MENRAGSDPKYAKYLYMHACHVHNKTANATLGYRTPDEKCWGITPDISHLRFSWWEQVLYYETDKKYPNSRMLPGRWLGIDTKTGDDITYHIVTMPQDDTRNSVVPR